MTGKVVDKYEGILDRAKNIATGKQKRTEMPAPIVDVDGSAILETGVPAETIKEIAEKITLIPETFSINPKMVGQLGRRAKMGTGEIPMDWGFAEAMAFGSLVKDGIRVRLSGQGSGRGTFSRRHAMMYDTKTGSIWSPLGDIRADSDPLARFQVFDSSLSENAVLGFEYGYSLKAPDFLVMWEAQFGDFSNGAQVIIDQYISASEDKWKERCRLVMLLPHGFEGQGPEHSSARLERYLQLCAENNMQVCNPTTPVQYFHMLRRQVLQERVSPLIVMTPKSLLRLPAASSTIDELISGAFLPVIDDALVEDRSKVKRIVLCSGKVYYDLETARQDANDGRVAIVRLEQYYPFPGELLKQIFAQYPNASQLFWVQEEPKNMGAWSFLEPRLRETMPAGFELRYVGRVPSASPATGSYAIHELEQRDIIERALIADSDEISAASEPEVAEKLAPATA